MNSGIYEDSDQDSLYEESPTDGYFSQRDIPQEIYTESPSSTSQSKAQEAAEESQQSQPSSAARTEPTQFRRPPSHSPTWVNEATPLLDDGPPPPTYSDATSTRPYGANSSAISRSDSWPEAQGSETDSQRSRDRFPVNYGTASTTPLLFLGNGLPQSMGGSGDEERGRDIAARQYRRKIRDCCSMKRLLELLLVSGVIAGVVLIMKLSGGSRDGTQRKHQPQPPTAPPLNDSYPENPIRPSCIYSEYSDVYVYDFASPESFSFVEGIDSDPSHLSGGLGGFIDVIRAPKEQDAAIRVRVSFATTAPWKVANMDTVQDAGGLYVKGPYLTRVDQRSSGFACMQVFVTILVKPGTQLANFEIGTENLGVRVNSGLFLAPNLEKLEYNDAFHVMNTTDIHVIKGDVSIAYWSSRETVIDTISGSVTGKYALRDLLSIRTRSGSVHVNVDPKPADKTSPAPADFTAISTSGSLTVHFPTDDSETDDKIPEREYRTRCETESGTITGEFILGLMASFRTTSGASRTTILPYAANMFASTLRTETRVGSTRVHVLTPLRDSKDVMNRLHSLHTSQAASLELKYPQSWEGYIDGETTSGSITLKGKDVERIKHYKGPLSTKILARKGEGNSRLDFSTTAGSVSVEVGDLY